MSKLRWFELLVVAVGLTAAPLLPAARAGVFKDTQEGEMTNGIAVVLVLAEADGDREYGILTFDDAAGWQVYPASFPQTMQLPVEAHLGKPAAITALAVKGEGTNGKSFYIRKIGRPPKAIGTNTFVARIKEVAGTHSRGVVYRVTFAKRDGGAVSCELRGGHPFLAVTGLNKGAWFEITIARDGQSATRLLSWKELKGTAEPDGPANGSQPIRSETTGTPPAAGSGR